MAGEKNFENRLKKWLEDEGIYPLGNLLTAWAPRLVASMKSVGAEAGM